MANVATEATCCARCGRVLKSPKAVANKMGAVCLRKSAALQAVAA